MSQRRLLALLLAVPILSVVLVGGAWFAGRWTSPDWAARVWVAKGSPGHVLLRAQVLHYPEGVAANEPLLVVATFLVEGHSEYRLRGETDAEGIVDFDSRLPQATGVSFRLDLDPPHGAALARGTWDSRAWPDPLVEVRREPTNVTLRPNGRLVTLRPSHGVLTVPVPDELIVTWQPSDDRQGQPHQLQLVLEGAVTASNGTEATSVNGGTTVITPVEHVVEVTVQERDAEGLLSSGVGLLPLVPGAIAARSSPDQQLLVISPVPRSTAYVVLGSRTEVVALERVALRPHSGPRGVTYEGTVPLSAATRGAPPASELYAVTSSELDLGSEAVVGWPLAPGQANVQFHWGQRIDGFTQQATDVRERLLAWRASVWAGLSLGCLVELILVGIYSRRRSDPIAGVSEFSLARLTTVLTCVVLGFAGLASLFAYW